MFLTRICGLTYSKIKRHDLNFLRGDNRLNFKEKKKKKH
jgi:hypothetical protein